MYWDSLTQVTGVDFTTTSITPVDITGLTFATAINSTYEVEALLECNTNTTSGMAFDVKHAGATGAALIIGGAAVGAIASDNDIINQTPNTVMIQRNSTKELVFIKAFIEVAATPGNITIQTQKQTSGTATVFKGSIMKVRKIL